MSTSVVFDKVCILLKEANPSIQDFEILSSSNFWIDLDFDSKKAMLVLILIERDFCCEFDTSLFVKVETVADVVRYVESQVPA
jgi:acyl carrier protein